MIQISKQYIDSIPPIYKDIFGALWMFNPMRRQDYFVPVQSLYSVLSDKYSLGEVSAACDSMAEGGVLDRKDEEFFHPTELGETILRAVTGQKPVELEPFPLPPGSTPD